MTRKTESVADLVVLLGHAKSPQRRRAAKKLRKLRDAAAGPALLEALRREVRDPRTWETQYQLVMALGECDHRAASPFLAELALRPIEATMIYVALGDALVRLSGGAEEMARAAVRILKDSTHDMLKDGALRALAMVRVVPDAEVIREIVAFVRARPLEDPRRFWVVAAAAGWKGPEVDEFLTECLSSPRRDVRDAAASSKQGRYGKWKPL
jgi:hypothetical protein